MFQNKLFNFALILIISIAMLGVVAIVGINYLGKSEAMAKKVPSAKELAESQFAVEKLTTNLSGSSLVQIGITLQLDSTKGVEELELRKSQVKDTITQILHATTQVDLQKPDGIQKLKEQIKENINKYLQKGKVVDVYFPELVVQ
ncbi:flagellar basal body-associated FliL family protein [Effusibacillus lacus]|uniref:Flagellar protein FliL n=1 Tax=Effusibacillus lacus TaxID=1348429 RepID=A0A292YDS7_9BACL|nr:flagellar basal body-associated FliL family protein [Effusibacillus lacus]GAX90532.1 flagellar basal body-associated protein FliL [Effusibacillus lacus]